MIKKEKLSGADCMQSTPFSFRYEPIFLQKMGYKRTSSQGIRPDVEMLGADTAIEAKSIHDGVLQNFYDSIFVLPLALPFVGEVFLVTIRCVKYFLLVMRMLLHEDNSFLLKN